MNKLRGRMLNMPKTKPNAKTEFLIVYGQKSTLEKWSPLANELRNYGNVSMPDLPGIGGMQSFDKIGELPTIDNYADYLNAYIKLRYRRKKIVIVGMSFGFVVVTRMLQKYPDIVNRANLVINLSGFVHKNDLKLSKWQRKGLWIYAKLFSYHASARVYRTFVYDEFIYARVFKKRYKNAKNLNTKEYKKLMKQELSAQKKNDTRSHMFTLKDLLRLDNTRETVDLPVWSLVGNYDEYLNSENVKSHLESVYSKYHEIKLKKNTHKVEYSEMTTEFFTKAMPYKLKVLLNRQNRQK